MSAMLSVPVPVPCTRSQFPFIPLPICLSLPFAYETRHVCFESVRSPLSSAHTYYVVCIHEATSVTTQTVHKPNPTQPRVSAAMRRAVRKLNTPSRMLVKFPFGMLLSLRFTRSFPPPLLHSFVVLVENLPFYRAQSERMTPHVGGIPLPLYSCHCCL